MTALKNCSAELRRYLFSHKLPEVFEALLTGLAIECPENACEFIVNKLSRLVNEQSSLEDLRWDSFVSPEKRPKDHLLRHGFDKLWCYEDENSQPTPEMYQLAYSVYNFKLKLMCFQSWSKYHSQKKKKRGDLLMKLTNARRYHRNRILRIYFTMYYNWYKRVKKIQKEISCRIKMVLKNSLVRMVFVAWRKVVAESRKTREYFEKIEKGEVIETGEYNKDFFITAEDGKDVISSLPKHLALLIFSSVDIQDLARCASVSRSWKLIVQSSILWSKMNFSKIKQKLSNKVGSRLLHNYRFYLVHLNFRGCSNLVQSSLKIIGECKNLQDLNVSDCHCVDDNVVKSVAAGCASLLYLNLSRCQITDATFRYLARSCVNLQFLSFAGCTSFTDKGLSYLAHSKGARKLSYLDLSACEQVSERGFFHISSGFLALTTIMLNDLPSLHDEQLKMLTDTCCSVKTISFLQSPLISDVGLKYLTKFRRLQKIQIEGNSRITDSAVKAIAKNCLDLRHVFITDCPRLTDLSLKALASCRHLIVLNIADCIRIQDAGVRQVVEGPSGAKLREINLTNCVRVSDVTLLRIAQRCHNLTYCSVCYCEHVTDAGLELLSTLPSLVSLDISGCNIQDHGVSSLGNSSYFRDITLAECKNIGDIGLQKMFQQCRYLENLDLSYCVNITDYAIKNLAFCCRLLRTLNLAGCAKLTDSSVQYLAGVCHYIEMLNLSECVLLTDRSLRYARKGLHNLKSLNIMYCGNFTKSSVRKLTWKCHDVQHCDDLPPVLDNPVIDSNIQRNFNPSGVAS